MDRIKIIQKILFAIFISLLPSCMPKQNLVKKHVELKQTLTKDKNITPKQPSITILIHGSRLFAPFDILLHPVAPAGLHPIQSFSPKHSMYQVATLLEEVDPERFQHATT